MLNINTRYENSSLFPVRVRNDRNKEATIQFSVPPPTDFEREMKTNYFNSTQGIQLED
jgi:hypothetical protein